MKKLPYRNCVAMFVKKNGKIFSGERSDIAGAWQLPQGGIEQNETILNAAKRELREETGIVSVKFLKQTSAPLCYNFPPESQEACLKKYGTLKYAGQQVTFVLFDFFGNDSEINLAATTPREFSNWKWTSPKDLLDGIVDFKKEISISAAKELGLI